ncbi:MAG: hypothetical protein ACJ8CR_16300 [Roseiflexaceae bacterium]
MLLEQVCNILIERQHVMDAGHFPLGRHNRSSKLRERVTPAFDLIHVMPRDSEQIEDDRRREPKGKLLHQIHWPARRELVDQLFANLAYARGQACNATGRKGLADDTPETGMFRWVRAAQLGDGTREGGTSLQERLAFRRHVGAH